jgi:hypothetical protein
MDGYPLDAKQLDKDGLDYFLTGLGLIGIVIDHVSTLIYSKKNKNVQVQ